MWGLAVCALGLLFGLVIYGRLKRLPVHGSMRENLGADLRDVQDYLTTQGRFILVLWVFIGLITGIYLDARRDRRPGTNTATRGFPPIRWR